MTRYLMTQNQEYLAHKKLYRFFPEMKFQYELLSYFGGKKCLEIKIPNTPHSIKGIAMDFEHQVLFNMQIFFVSLRSQAPSGLDKSSIKQKFFTNPDGAESNHFYSFQPGIHTHWASQIKFVPPDDITNNQMRLEIPWLKENGMGLFLFERDEFASLKEHGIDELTFRFTFIDPDDVPNHFTIYIFRNKRQNYYNPRCLFTISI